MIPLVRVRLAELVPAERCGTSPLRGAPRVLAAGVRQLRGRTSALVDVEGAAVEVDLATPHGRRFYAYGFCEPAARAMRSLLEPGDVMIDAGANIGLFTVLAAARVGAQGRVIACEPSPGTMALLRANVERNAFGWVELHEAAVAEAPGRLELEVFEAGSGSSSFAPAQAGGRRVEVAVTTLDELAGEHLERVRVVKLDVEGAELRALRGASGLLERARPDFIVELEPEHLARQGATVADVQALFEDAGYVAYAIRPGGLEALHGPWQRPAGDPNVVLRPRERDVDGLRFLMYSHYPPMRGGIAAYAAQGAARLREHGHEVTVASTELSDAEHVVDLRVPGTGRSLARLAGQSDRLVVQFHPEMLGVPGESTLVSRTRALLRLAQALRAAPSAELCFHEVNYGAGPLAPVQQRFARVVWNLADEITVHTEREREDFLRAFGVDPGRIRVVSQNRYMARLIRDDRAVARAALGLPAEPVILVSLGFLQPNKGFDRAIRAFRGADARLYLVGSVWRESEDRRGYVEELRRLAAETPGAELREAYLSDEDFDRWIVASDALVLPYVEGWSSNVMERGLLYDRPVIMSRLGGMAEQGADRPGVTLVADDAALAEAMHRVVATARKE